MALDTPSGAPDTSTLRPDSLEQLSRDVEERLTALFAARIEQDFASDPPTVSFSKAADIMPPSEWDGELFRKFERMLATRVSVYVKEVEGRIPPSRLQEFKPQLDGIHAKLSGSGKFFYESEGLRTRALMSKQGGINQLYHAVDYANALAKSIESISDDPGEVSADITGAGSDSTGEVAGVVQDAIVETPMDRGPLEQTETPILGQLRNYLKRIGL